MQTRQLTKEFIWTALGLPNSCTDLQSENTATTDPTSAIFKPSQSNIFVEEFFFL